MYKFSQKQNSVTVHEHELGKRGIDCEGVFKLKYGDDIDRIKCDVRDDLYYFTLLYKDFFLNGEYIFNEELNDTDLKGMIIQYEVKNGNLENHKNHKFMDYCYRTPQNESPRFYFEVGKNIGGKHWK
tara:strand:- start:824 stop:1204 length:381 start_codon:yes stop_codon:yes gene_type:complete